MVCRVDAGPPDRDHGPLDTCAKVAVWTDPETDCLSQPVCQLLRPSESLSGAEKPYAAGSSTCRARASAGSPGGAGTCSRIRAETGDDSAARSYLRQARRTQNGDSSLGGSDDAAHGDRRFPERPRRPDLGGCPTAGLQRSCGSAVGAVASHCHCSST